MPEQSLNFVARLAAVMGAANYPVTLIRQMITRSTASYGLTADFIALPNHVQLVTQGNGTGSIVKTANYDEALGFHQMFPLARLVSRTIDARTPAPDGLAELDRIVAAPAPYPAWVTVLGYGVQSAGFALLLEPTRLNVLMAAVLGLLVGMFRTAGQRVPGLSVLVPTASAFAVTAACIIGVHHLELDHLALRALIAPLAMFLPGAAITLAVIELTSRDIVSGSSRLTAGFIQLAQLAFGILIAAQLFSLNENQITATAVNKLGPWAPWLGVIVYALGVMLFLAPPRSFFPWLVLITYTAYIAQFFGDRLLGSYASGFCGAVVLTVAALAVSRHPSGPPAITLILPGFWLLVPGSMGLIGITELYGVDGDSALPATLISMISVAIGIQAGLVIWRAVRGRHA